MWLKELQKSGCPGHPAPAQWPHVSVGNSGLNEVTSATKCNTGRARSMPVGMSQGNRLLLQLGSSQGQRPGGAGRSGDGWAVGNVCGWGSGD